MGGTDTVVHRWPQTCHGFWATPGDGSSLEDPTISLSPQPAATRCEIQGSPLRRVPWCREPAGLHAADGCQTVVVANHGWLGPGVLLEAALLVAQDSLSNPPSVLGSRLQARTVHAVTRRGNRLFNIDLFAMQMLSIENSWLLQVALFHNGPRTLWCSVTSALHTIRCGCLTCIHLAWMRNPAVERDRSAAT